MSNSWTFQPNSYWYGWDETGLSIFSGQPRRSLVREMLQNSLDAKLDQADKVRVRFELTSLPRNMIPDIERLTQILQCCVDASMDESQDSQDAVRDAHKFCERMNFPVLTCTDFGTTGMAGPYQKGNPFFTYMATKGSSPGAPGRVGSHGHGKDAPLANSIIRTIFASSTYLDEKGQRQHLAQGKCVFMSHLQDGEQFENHGRWGAPDMQPVSDLEAQYAWINPFPEELGTSVSIVGFPAKPKDDWSSELIGHALISYFPAFIRGLLELEFKSAGQVIKIEKENFLDYLTSEPIKNALANIDRDLASEFDRTSYFVSALMESRGGKTRDQQAQAPLNHVDLHIYVADDAPRAYCLIRGNTKICEKVPSLLRIPSKYRDFACVIECQSEEANALIRSMEPSEHDRVEVSRLSEQKKPLAEKLWKLLREKFIAVLDQEALSEQKVSGQIDFLAKFFPDLADDESGISFEDDEGFDGERIQIKPKVKKRRRKQPDVIPPDPSPDPSPPPNPRPAPPGPEPEPTPTPVKRLEGEVHAQRVVELGDGRVRLVIRLDQPRTCRISLLEVGHEGAQALPIGEGSLGTLKHGAIELEPAAFSEDSSVVIDAEVAREVSGGYLIKVEVPAS